jgi:hypothetical protein
MLRLLQLEQKAKRANKPQLKRSQNIKTINIVKNIVPAKYQPVNSHVKYMHMEVGSFVF